jgi:glycosyltransferase involved in cell wall biosynthesis
VPKVVYFHENQLTYPVQHESERDYQFGFTNITACLAADRVWFNSEFHRREFLDAARGLLARMPDFVPEGVPETIAERSATLPLGCDLASLDVDAAPREGPAVILWNHRWEYDKNPEGFFSAVFDLADEGLDFRLAIAGQSFRQVPLIFDVAHRRLADRIEHYGYLESRGDYARLLRRCDVTVSTAHHEFFGIAAVEALYCGCYPLFPNKLTYPEILPPEHHARHLYDGPEDLLGRLREAVVQIDATRQVDLRGVAARFDWSALIGQYDDAFEALAR